MSFRGKTILITGASGNLGRALAEAFRADGAGLGLVAGRAQSLEAAYPGGRAGEIKVAADLTAAAAAEEAVRRIEAELGPIHAVCATAGGFHMGEAIAETSAEHWARMMDINAMTLVNTVRAVIPGMSERGAGKIVTVGAGSGLKGAARMGPYVVAKSAVLRITETLAAELRDTGINVNCVLPGTIDTPENRAAMPKADRSKWVSPTDLAAVMHFLCSDAAKAVHGALIPVTGRS